MKNNFKYASFLNRFFAIFIDICIWMLISAVFVEIASKFLPLEVVKYIDGMFPVIYLIFFVYFFEATPGKMFVGIKVVSESGVKMNLMQVVIRETIGRFMSFAPLFFGYLWVIADDKSQGFHDKMARTVVIREEVEE